MVAELRASEDPIALVKSWVRPWNCEGEGRVRLDNVPTSQPEWVYEALVKHAEALSDEVLQEIVVAYEGATKPVVYKDAILKMAWLEQQRRHI